MGYAAGGSIPTSNLQVYCCNRCRIFLSIFWQDFTFLKDSIGPRNCEDVLVKIFCHCNIFPDLGHCLCRHLLSWDNRPQHNSLLYIKIYHLFGNRSFISSHYIRSLSLKEKLLFYYIAPIYLLDQLFSHFKLKTDILASYL